jgi:hypothetical protein
VAQNRIEAAARENFLQAVSRSPYRNRITDPYFAEVVECDALANQLPFESAVETESERRRHVRAQVLIPREREQKRLYASVQIAGADMQDPHGFIPP